MVAIPLPISSSTGEADNVINAFAINMYSVESDAGSRVPFYLQGCAGLDEWADMNDGPVRAAEELAGNAYVVSGPKVYKVAADQSFTEHGDLSNGSISPSTAGFEYILTIGESGEIFLIDNDGVTRVTNNPFPAMDVIFYAGVFVFLRKYTDQEIADLVPQGEYFVSEALADEGEKISFDTLAFANAETEADPAIALARIKDTLVILGSKTVEFFRFGSGVPFPAIPGVFFDVGCAARDTAVSHDGVLYYLGNDGTVRRNSETISNSTVEDAIADAAGLDGSSAFVFKERGRVFISFTFGTSVTWVYSLSTGSWNQRKSYLRDTWQPSISIEFDGNQLLGDSISGKLLKVDRDVFDFDGQPRLCTIQTPYIHAELRSLIVDYIKVLINGSAGTIAVPDPHISFRYSFDGGFTWSKKLTEPMGGRGQRRVPIKWTDLGQTDQDVLFEFEVSDAVEFQMIQLDGGFKVGPVS